MNPNSELEAWSEPERQAPRIDVWLRPEALRRSLEQEAREGLTRTPRELSPKWLYDARGSELFEAITQLPEYYPTRREREILKAHSRGIAQRVRADTLIELGSGFSTKTRLLLDALQDTGRLRRFVPFDVSEAALRVAADQLAEEYPDVALHGVVGDFDHHLSQLPQGGRRLIAFLGGTIGNFKPEDRARFLATVASGMREGDFFLLGTDLLKDEARLNLAYNDSAGVTAAFNLNVLSVINRELAANFDLDGFRHLARFDREHHWIEMLLISERRQTVRVPALDLSLTFEEGEKMRTEVSTKFQPAQVGAELGRAGLQLVDWWTDAAGDFALSLSTIK